MDKESWRRGGDSRPVPRGETSFDELAKELAEGKLSRRNALRWIGGTLVGSLLASIPGVALATPQSQPPGGQNCPPGRVKCQGDCVDRSSDPNNCGQCRNICTPTQECVNGECVGVTSPPPPPPPPSSVCTAGDCSQCSTTTNYAGGTTTTGVPICANVSQYNTSQPCGPTTICPTGTVCVNFPGCAAQARCVPPCPTGV
jgi:hypothetical protein